MLGQEARWLCLAGRQPPLPKEATRSNRQPAGSGSQRGARAVGGVLGSLASQPRVPGGRRGAPEGAGGSGSPNYHVRLLKGLGVSLIHHGLSASATAVSRTWILPRLLGPQGPGRLPMDLA